MSEDICVLSLVDFISRVPPNRATLAVFLFKLFGARISRSLVASGRVFVLASHDVGIRMDDEYTTACRRH